MNPTRSTASNPPNPAHNVVVISDLHLGEDLGVEASEQTRRDVAMGANAACDFLAHLTHRRVDGRPWRLVVNGDFLDFQAAFVPLSHPGLAGVAELGGTGVTDRLISGAGRVPVASAIRVDRIAEAHPRVFTALARFLRAGNRIDFVAGNHDREITHPTVAARMRAALVRGGALAAETTARVDFHEWFVLEPGVAWIEHGHQYDAQCSFEHGLSPYDGHGEVIPNVDAASVRHLGSVAGVDAHSTEEWSFGGYVQHAASLGPRGFVRLVGGYARFMMGLWRASRIQRGLRQRGRRAADHERRLAELATERGLSVGELRDLDGLRRMPVTRNMTRVCRMLMLDRLALLALALVGAVLVAAIGGWPWGFVGGVGTLLGGVVGGEAMAGRPPRDPSVALAMIPERIRRVTHVPVVVFGHTHIPQEVALPGGGTYVNGGTWLPAIHPGLLRAFTHVVILRGPDGPTVRLRQWRDGHSRPYVPDVDHGRAVAPSAAPAPVAAPLRPAAVVASVAATVTGRMRAESRAA